MSLWLYCWWLWPSLSPVCQVCRKIIFCSFGMFEFLLRSTLFCFRFKYCWLSYLGVHSDRALSIWASTAKFKQLWPTYRFFKPKKLSQTQESEKHLFWKLIFKSGCVLVIFFAQIKTNSIYIPIGLIICPDSLHKTWITLNSLDFNISL